MTDTRRPHRSRRVVARTARWAANRRHLLPLRLDRLLESVRWRLPNPVLRRLGAPGESAAGAGPTATPPLPPVPDAATRLFVGPANFAGQGYAWVRAATRLLPDTRGIALCLETRGGFGFPCDYTIPMATYARHRDLQRALFDYVTGFTHVIIEAERPLFASRFGFDAFAEARILEGRDLRVAMMAHGTDVRLPSRHASRHPWSPFRDRDWAEVPRLQANARRNIARLGRFSGTVFVTTPDLLQDLPFATWCPVVVDVAEWHNPRPLFDRERPVVVHAPSNSRTKGTADVERAMAVLESEGLVTYRRAEGATHAQMPAVYADADVVLDQFRLGSYGVSACEAMASGKVVVGNVTEEVRTRVRERTGQVLPVVQALPDEIERVVRGLLADRETAVAAGRAGTAFVSEVHDGRSTARHLSEFLGGPT